MRILKYSFIVPVYNCEKFLENCIESIRAQKNVGYEIILVDDGSADGSGRLCDKYAEAYDNIHAYHKENGGASSARNFGIDKSNGKYLIFIDGDDTIEPQMLGEIDNAVSDNTDMVIYGMTFDFYRDTSLARSDIMVYPKNAFFSVKEFGDEFKRFFECNGLSSACNKVFIKKIIDDNTLRFNTDMTIYEDFDFVLRYLGCIRNNILCISNGYYHYRLNERNNHYRKRVSDFRMIEKNLECMRYSIFALADRYETFKYAKDLYVSLYLDLFSAGLIYSEKAYKSAADVLDIYNSNACLKELLQTGVCGSNEFGQVLLKNSRNRLVLWVLKRKSMSRIRHAIKELLIKLKLR